MSEIDGGPAFPSEQGETSKGWNQTYESGLTKREYFAAMALQGLLANPSTILKQADIPELSFEYADAMIRQGKSLPC
jgi:hypothetical protein